MSFPGGNSMLSDPQLQSAVDVPHFPTAHGGMTEMTTVRFEQDQGVGTIVLANPPQNRIGSQFAEDLRAAVHDASLSDSRVLVIRSEGPNFCLGGNVPEWVGKSADWFRTFIAECNSSFHAIEALRIPTVAVVRGGAIGGGFELALLATFWSQRRMRHFSPSRFVPATFRWQAGYSGSQNGLGAPAPLNSLYWVSRSAASSRAIWALLRSWG